MNTNLVLTVQPEAGLLVIALICIILAYKLTMSLSANWSTEKEEITE